jgi:GT2 family glycosyltransferase
METLGGAAQQGLQIPAWDTLIHKWRNHWSDYELRKICTQAKLWQQEHQQFVQKRQAQEEIVVLLEQEQVRHQDIVATFQQRIEVMAERLTCQQRELEAVTAGLTAIESSTIWRASYPFRWLIIHLRASWQQWGAPAISAPLPQIPMNTPCPPNLQPIDVIIPVYRGLAETRACLDSVLTTVPTDLGQIIVINDASPEPELIAWLEQLAEQHPRLILLHNPENLGFVQTCNRGMALHPEHDVVLLNSDTEVANDWLTRLQACAYRDRHIGTVTPFSNNATICSYPRLCFDNPLPQPWSTAELDALFRHCNQGQLMDIPTPIGFCMYIRRDCLRAVGYFDERHFGKGYGEENDFSMRAKALGWRHVLCADVFVYHAGSVSFADHQNQKKRRAMAILNRLHPDFEPMVHQHIARDPARPFRLRVDLARLARSRLPVVLLVVHDRGGGTKRHIEELAELFTDTLQFLLLRPGGNSQYLLSWLRSGETLQLIFNLPGDADALLESLRALAVRRIHFHHTLGLHPLFLDLPALLSLPYDFTIHDYYTCCPQITLTHYQNHYCGEPDDAGCNRCLAILPAPGGGDIQTWRQRHQFFFTQAARVLAPSQDAARRFTRYFPTAKIQWAPHPDLDDYACPAPQSLPLSADAPLRIVVLGALSPIKGADVLEQCAANACQRGLPLAFHLVGYAYRDLHRPPREFLKIHGPYDDADLPKLLTQARPHLVWFPALWPETYSYTLSACLRLGLPVVVPDLGAFPERVAGRPWSWIRPWQQSAHAWNDFFMQIRMQCFVPGCPPTPAAGRAESPSFNYRRNYWIAGDPAATALDEAKADAILATVATTFAYPRLTGAARRQATIKLGLLRCVVRLRGMPMLRWAVRRIPLGWQSRVKTWLRGSV